MEILSEKLRPSYPGYEAEVDRLADACINSRPYTHCVLDPLCDASFLAKVHRELTTSMKADFKETDLFKVFQTAELGAISEESLKENMPSFLQLRTIIYSQEFRNMIQRITGCAELIDRVDCSANAYANSCHLLCHDDVIGTRCVSYIIYLSDPDEPWTVEEGGEVELYPLDESSIVDPTNVNNLQGVPVATPSKSILPTFNSMLFFTVQPGRSYHSVQEVFSKHRPRISISGWYHAAHPPVGSDMSSLQQILSKGDKVDCYAPIPYQVTPIGEVKEFPKGTIYGLTKADIRELSQWLSSDYLTKKSIDQIRDQFIDDSSVQLHNFLSPTISEDILHKIIAADHDSKLGKGRPSLDYSVGQSSQWTILGPPHKKRYLQFSPDASTSTTTADEAGKLLHSVGEFLHSELFAKYISAITTVIILSYQQEIRRFRPGFDYTVAHYSLLTKEKHLDATLCFVNDDNDVEKRILEELDENSNKGDASKNGAALKNKKRKAETEKKKKGKKSSVSISKESDGDEEEEVVVEEENEEEDYAIQWDGGDVGGFECFIEADDDAETAEAAEVYRQEKEEVAEEEEEKDMTTADKTKNRKEQSTLLSVSARTNSLSLVLRDEGIMKFVKYVSANAPGSRWDVATEYKILDTGDEDDDEEDDEESENDSKAEDDN
jgi:Rps23 Pro-64 3,4-dihydroxylase Tpa1-like proline 4-hydroxylase